MMICGVCGKKIEWNNRWEIINHYDKDTMYGSQGLQKTIYTFCSQGCMLDYLNRNTFLCMRKSFFNTNLIAKSILRKKH